MSFNPENVWLRFETDEGETPDHEANIVRRIDSDGLEWFTVEWSNTDTGLVMQTEEYATIWQCEKWLESAGYQDFTA